MVFGQKSKKPLALRVPVQDWPGLDSQNPSSSSEDEATTSSSGPSTSRTAPGRDAQQRKGSVSHKLPSQQSHETNISWLVLSLATDDAEEQLQTAHMLLDITKDPRNQEAAREAGAVTCLAALLAGGAAHPVVPVALEALALLIVQCKENKDILRTSKGAVRQVVRLLGALQLDVQHRALLLVRLMTERDCDRHAVFRYGGIRKLVALLSSKTSSIRENAAGAIGNLAAGSAEVKDELRRAGAVPKLVSLLAGENEVLAEFSSGALMNMSLKNADNRQAILAAGGLEPLLKHLSKGQQRLLDSWDCRVQTVDGNLYSATISFEVTKGHMLISRRGARNERRGFFTPRGPRSSDPEPSAADVYSMLSKFKMVEPQPDTLEMRFNISEDSSAFRGLAPIHVSRSRDLEQSRVLSSVEILLCPANEIRAAVLKMMTRVHMEREFRSGPFPAQEAWPQDVGNGQQLQESGCCTPAARPTMLTPEGAIPPALLEHNLPHQDRLRADGGRSASGPPLLSVPKGSDKPQRQHGSPLPPLRAETSETTPLHHGTVPAAGLARSSSSDTYGSSRPWRPAIVSHPVEPTPGSMAVPRTRSAAFATRAGTTPADGLGSTLQEHHHVTPVRMYLDVSLMDVHPADQTPGSVLAARTYHVNFAGGAGSGTIPAELQVPEGRGSHLLDYRPAAEPMSPVSTSMGLLDVHASSPTKSPGSWLKRAKENEIPI